MTGENMKKMNIKIVALMVAFGTMAAHAMPTAGETELNRAAIQVQRKTIVEMNMKMDQQTATVFWPIYNDYIGAMQKSNDRATALLTEYAANWLDLSEEKAASLLDDFISVKQEQLKVKKSFAKKFSKALSPKVAARFFQIDNKLDAIIAYELAQNVPLVH
jgi:hypothetical protein